MLCGSFLPCIYMRTIGRTLFQKLSSFQLLLCYKGGKYWSSMIVFFLFQFHYFFFLLSLLHFLSDPISFSIFFLSFFLSFPQQTKTTEIKENSNIKWGWLQGTPNHEPRLVDTPISRPLLSSATNSCSALNSSSVEIHNYLKPISISF